MSLTAKNLPSANFAFSSSVKADVWHSTKPAKAYEWWYFDALSDDGNEAVVIVFLDNFIYSPRYNKSEPKNSPPYKGGVAAASADGVVLSDSGQRFPAVSFIYYRNGKPVYRAVNEFSANSFEANEQTPECKIANSTFRLESVPYGSGYTVSINTSLSRGRWLKADFEWLSIESDFAPEAFCHEESLHCWNMVAPRSDVSGRISIFDKKGKETDVRQFRGTGYHDHNLDNRWLAKTVRDWHWGRAHFADATAVFYRYCELGDDSPSTKLYLIRDGKLHERNVGYEEQNYARDKFGIKYPTRLRLISDDNMRLRVKPLKVIDSSFFYLRFLSEMNLTLRDGKPRKTIGITEFIAPKTLRYRWLNWLSDMRTGRKGKGPLF